MKSVFINLFFILMATTLFVSCKKKKVTYVVTGKVNDDTFSQGLSGITLKIEIKKSGNAYYSLLTNVNTDASGNYTFSVENDLYEKVRITSEITNYFSIERVFSYAELTQNGNVYNLNTTAKSWARLIFKNDNPSPNDHLQYIKQSGKYNCSICCSAEEQNLYGAINDTFYCINDGNTTYSYLYSVIGTSNNGFKSVYTAAFDTSTVILNY